VVVAWLAACGGGHSDATGGAPDAALTDATLTDAASIDAPPTSPAAITIKVLSDLGDGKPDTSARVIFADGSRSLVKQGLVDASGAISAELPQGGIVHVMKVLDLSAHDRVVRLTSIQVKPGDSLTFGSAASRPQGAAITVQGTFTPIPNVVAIYDFAHPCGGGLAQPGEGTTARLSSVAGCLPPTFEVLGTPNTASHISPPQYVWFTATPAGGFTAPAMQPMPAFTARVSNVPAGSDVTVLRSTQIAPYFLDAETLSTELTATTTTVTADLFYPPSATALGVVEARISPAPFDRRTQLVRTRVTGAVASADLDLNALPLPSVQTAPTLSGRVVSWTQTGTGTPDLRAVTSVSAHVAGGWSYRIEWTLIDGASDSAVEIPGLPDMFADVDPTQQLTSVSSEGTILYLDFSNVQGHDSARRLPLGSLLGTGVGRYGDGLFDHQLYTVHASIR
jgi:hypothetical protein